MHHHLKRARTLLRHAALKIFLYSLFLAIVAGPVESHATEKPFPKRPITIVLPWPAGGGVDTITRMLASEMESAFGQRVLVENRPGATGAIGLGQVRRTPADGYTIFVVNTATHALQPTVNKALPYDAFRDFEPIGKFGYFPFGLMVRANLPIGSFSEFLAASKNSKDGLSIGVPGAGSIAHLFGSIIAKRTGANIVFIQYPGDVAAQRDLFGDHIAGIFGTVNFGLLDDGKARLLVSSGPERWKQAPDAPTLGESGFSDLVAVVMWGFAAPADTPKEIIELFNKTLQQAGQRAAVKKAMDTFGFFPAGGTPQELWTFYAEQKRRYEDFDGLKTGEAK